MAAVYAPPLAKRARGYLSLDEADEERAAWFAAIGAALLESILRLLPRELWVHHIVPHIVKNKRDFFAFRGVCHLFRRLAGPPRWLGDMEKVHKLIDPSIFRVTAACAWRGQLAVGYWDGEISVWSRDLFWREKSLRGHTEAVKALVEWQELLASCSLDYTIRLWNAAGECVRVLEGHTGGVMCLAVYGDLLASGSRDCSMRLWNAAGECTAVLEGEGMVVCLTVFNGCLVSGSDDKTVMFCNERGEQVRKFNVYSEPVCLSTWGDLLAVGLYKVKCSDSTWVRPHWTAGIRPSELNDCIDLFDTDGVRKFWLTAGSKFLVFDGLLVSMDNSGHLQVWDETRKCVAQLWIGYLSTTPCLTVLGSSLAISHDSHPIILEKRLSPRELLFPL
ncbi:MAG: hypothetical protein ACTSX8_02750 [Alphaproteobacteria bacterium]